MRRFHVSSCSRIVAIVCVALLLVAACGSDATEQAGQPEPAVAAEATAIPEPTTAPITLAEPEATATPLATAEPEAAPSDETITESEAAPADETAPEPDSTTPVDTPAGCDAVAAQFVTRGSANPDLDDPEVAAVCDGNIITITSNAIPDYTYIGTSPGIPTDRDNSYTIPATPTMADTLTDVPVIGTAAVTLSGIPIFGPTEGTGGDVDSLPGIISECGSHNGPSGFHIHKIMTSVNTDCLFSPEQVASGPQLVGYAFDGFPIYTGDHAYTSSWALTDDTLFATDTWAAHSYVPGSGDLDQCNGLTDADGNYAYYTTATFPYVLGCYVGVVDITGAGGGGGDRPERPEGEEDADRPERPEGEEGAAERPEPADGEGAAERPEPADGEEAAGRPERPERPEGEDGGERPERPERPEGETGQP